MPKTVTVTIHEPYLEVLEKWASVGRTLRTAENACEDVSAMSESTIEKYRFCAQEMAVLIPALEHMHMQVREQLWQK